MSDARVLHAVLGWRNPEDDGQSLRLYALDVHAPRWWPGNPAGRTAELALADYGDHEGDRYLLVRVGDRHSSTLAEYLADRIAELVAAAKETD